MRKTDPYISVIIPIYNLEKYLPECIDSVINQTLKDIEIIIINDASSDASELLIKKYMQLDKRIKLINNHTNLGAGKSKNIGIKKSISDYVFFIDGDDYLNPQTLEKLYLKAIKIDADYIGYNHIKIWEDSNKIVYHHFEKFEDKYFQTMGPITKLYKKEFLLNNNIFFDTFRVGEDMCFAFKVYMFAKKYDWLDFDGYYYVQHRNSLSYPNKENDKKIALGIIKALKKIDVFLSKNQKNQKNQNFNFLLKRLQSIKINYLYTHYLRRHPVNRNFYLSKVNDYLKDYPKIYEDFSQKIYNPILKNYFKELKSQITGIAKKNIILYGFNDLAILLHLHFYKRIYSIIDKNRYGEIYQNHIIQEFDDIDDIKNKSFIITAINEKYIQEIKNTILDRFPKAHIIHLPNNPSKHFHIHKFTEDIKLTKESQNRLDFFLKSEEVQMSIFLKLIKKFNPDIVFDIGANVGLYTLISYKYFPKMKYFSFEPTPNVLKDLKENINFITKKNEIKVFDLALSSKDEIQTFYDFGKSSGRNGIADTSINHSVKNLATEIKVKSTRLDSITNSIDKTYLLKIDTEGHELEVLKGAKQLLNDNNCIIQLELEYLDKNEISQFLSYLNYNEIFTMGPDSYFTNIKELKDINEQKTLLEDSINSLIFTKWNKEFIL